MGVAFRESGPNESFNTKFLAKVLYVFLSHVETDCVLQESKEIYKIKFIQCKKLKRSAIECRKTK